MNTLQTYLVPIPSVVINNYNEKLLSFKWKNKKIIFAPHSELVVNLFYRGYFQGFDVIGAFDRSPSKIGKSFYGLSVYKYDSLLDLDVDIVVVANTRYHKEIYNDLLSVAEKNNILIFDLCENYDHSVFRRELARKLDCREIARLRPECIDLPERLGPKNQMKVEVIVDAGWGLGDKLCALSAAREFARMNPNLHVYFNTLPSVVSAFNDQLIHLGRGAYPLPENNAIFHREKDSSPAGNYLGCYYLGLGLDFDVNPSIELPDIEPLDGLIPGSYIALQPTSHWAQPNLTEEQLKAVIENSPLPVVLAGSYIPVNAIGKMNHKEREIKEKTDCLAGADSSYLGDELAMLSIIRHAALVVAPRSASAHIASGYRTKSVIWIPSDGENWHLDYPNWEHIRVVIEQPDPAQEIINAIHTLLEKD